MRLMDEGRATHRRNDGRLRARIFGLPSLSAITWLPLHRSPGAEREGQHSRETYLILKVLGNQLQGAAWK